MLAPQTLAFENQNVTGKLVVALDLPARNPALKLAAALRGHAGLFKVGLELFSAEGPSLVQQLIGQGDRVFLDLKLHDIPNTVRGAAGMAARLGVSMMTVHASGGVKMMQAAVKGAQERAAGPPPLVLGVTALTSLAAPDLAEIGWTGSPDDVVLRLAALARSAGLDGVVISPKETALVRKNFGPNFVIVTPGIRPLASPSDDQARAASPGSALQAGADFLVIGRPITQALDPVSAADAIADEMRLALRRGGLEAVRE